MGQGRSPRLGAAVHSQKHDEERMTKCLIAVLAVFAAFSAIPIWNDYSKHHRAELREEARELRLELQREREAVEEAARTREHDELVKRIRDAYIAELQKRGDRLWRP